MVIDETIHLSFAGTTRTESYRYVMNRTSMQMLDNAGSYAFGNPDSLIQGKGDYRSTRLSRRCTPCSAPSASRPRLCRSLCCR